MAAKDFLDKCVFLDLETDGTNYMILVPFIRDKHLNERGILIQDRH